MRSHDPDKTRAEILEVARRTFAEKGLAGARIDEIAALTRTSKRMIYYYFGDKDGLYRAVLGDVLATLANAQSRARERLQAPLEPLDALAELVGDAFDFTIEHEDVVRLLLAENIQFAEHLRQLPLQEGAVWVAGEMGRILARGVAAQVMASEVDPRDLHISMASLCSFIPAYRYTFPAMFGLDMTSAEAVAARREAVIRTVLRAAASSGAIASGAVEAAVMRGRGPAPTAGAGG